MKINANWGKPGCTPFPSAIFSLLPLFWKIKRRRMRSSPCCLCVSARFCPCSPQIFVRRHGITLLSASPQISVRGHMRSPCCLRPHTFLLGGIWDHLTVPLPPNFFVFYAVCVISKESGWLVFAVFLFLTIYLFPLHSTILHTPTLN
jgi:hypothetical protein